jgi:L-amino acid N-acyltransferase YncA
MAAGHAFSTGGIPVPQTTTRLARAEDIPVLAVFEREMARATFPSDPIEDLEYHAERLRKALTREPEGMIVLVDSESQEILAWLWTSVKRTLATGEQYGVLRSIYVRPSVRRCGLGTLLAQYALRRFESLGVSRVVATVHRDNLAAARTLSRAGFAAEHVTYQWRASAATRTPEASK